MGLKRDLCWIAVSAIMTLLLIVLVVYFAGEVGPQLYPNLGLE